MEEQRHYTTVDCSYLDLNIRKKWYFILSKPLSLGGGRGGHYYYLLLNLILNNTRTVSGNRRCSSRTEERILATEVGESD